MENETYWSIAKRKTLQISSYQVNSHKKERKKEEGGRRRMEREGNYLTWITERKPLIGFREL